MRYFTLLDWQHWIVAVSLGWLAVILVYVAWGLSPAEDEEAGGMEPPADELPPEAAAKRPMPPILILCYVGAILWALAYALVEGIFGGPIG